MYQSGSPNAAKDGKDGTRCAYNVRGSMGVLGSLAVTCQSSSSVANQLKTFLFHHKCLIVRCVYNTDMENRNAFGNRVNVKVFVCPHTVDDWIKNNIDS